MDEKTCRRLEILLGGGLYKRFLQALQGELPPLETLAAIRAAEDGLKVAFQKLTMAVENAAQNCRDSQAVLLGQQANGQK